MYKKYHSQKYKSQNKLNFWITYKNYSDNVGESCIRSRKNILLLRVSYVSTHFERDVKLTYYYQVDNDHETIKNSYMQFYDAHNNQKRVQKIKQRVMLRIIRTRLKLMCEKWKIVVGTLTCIVGRGIRRMKMVQSSVNKAVMRSNWI